MSKSLAELFRANFQAHCNERAYGQRRGYRMEWFTYGQVMEMAFQLCRELEARGIAKGERVMLWGENCAEWVAAFFGCAICGVIVVPMDDGSATDFAARVARQVEARLWVTSRRNSLRCEDAGGAAVPVFVLDELSKRIDDSNPRSVSDVAVDRNDILQIVF